MTTISDPVEWLKAQVEMYLDDRADAGLPATERIVVGDYPDEVLRKFIEYVEGKFTTKGLFDR